ncbi:LysR family transcriptional regulator [Robbsia andropogonis]|uniref:LysR family transcriptional regulator n=1 Tax=Robbsia andropogonis TaxID=28092 RepID=A0A0F5JYC3_9BURK|nr:LysR family transcriptional regulator [Robbsia andropogonis]KKB62833.1 LysR family transcriptional regulator [Robbsia andropogonis]MCP1118084.1 LysR family transcriptional regulator [Robbsia andropogonis]MCP1127635.1 LysR family transcriptional regulator [Robbsia andropogonis]
MELRHLRYFVAVATTQNFTRAAEMLNISQPPLSRQIQQIEEEIGARLFERGSRPVKLTEAGRFFLGQARRLLEQADDLPKLTRRAAHVESRLVIGFVGSTLYGAVPTVVRRFRVACPHTEVSLVEMSTVDQLKALHSGAIDVGFGRIRLDDVSVKRVVLRDERLLAALPDDHPLCGVGPLTLAQLARETLVVYPRRPRPSYADQVLSAFKDQGLEPEEIHEVQELQTALGFVAAGMGVALVPMSVERLRRDDVVYRSLADASVVSPIIMSTRLADESEELEILKRLIEAIYA